MYRFQFVALAVLLQGAFLSSVNGQDALAELYGQGVHAYNSGDLNRANELLTQAIDSGLEDARVFYFRGLTQARLGGTGAGTADFQQGALLEMTGKRMVNVPQALERVQGPVRVEIEKVRQAARISARAQQLLLQKARIEQGIQAGSIPPATNSGLSKPLPDGKIDPFADDGGLISGEKKPMPRDVAPAPATNVRPEVNNAPFGDPAPAPKNAAPNPFNAGPPPAADPFNPRPAAPAAPAVIDPFK